MMQPDGVWQHPHPPPPRPTQPRVNQRPPPPPSLQKTTRRPVPCPYAAARTAAGGRGSNAAAAPLAPRSGPAVGDTATSPTPPTGQTAGSGRRVTAARGRSRPSAGPRAADVGTTPPTARGPGSKGPEGNGGEGKASGVEGRGARIGHAASQYGARIEPASPSPRDARGSKGRVAARWDGRGWQALTNLLREQPTAGVQDLRRQAPQRCVDVKARRRGFRSVRQGRK
jgi:hypothetical protein